MIIEMKIVFHFCCVSLLQHLNDVRRERERDMIALGIMTYLRRTRLNEKYLVDIQAFYVLWHIKYSSIFG
jgi:hypothetical protein